ncbi:hypothetical protein LTR65_010768 [Meristemomyces frigidus]
MDGVWATGDRHDDTAPSAYEWRPGEDPNESGDESYRPPPYSRRDEHINEASDHPPPRYSLADSLRSGSSSSSSSDNASPVHTVYNPQARVRRFLVHCLAIDYEITSELPHMLDTAHWYHFTRLSALCDFIHRKRYPRAMHPMLDWPDDCYDPDVDRELVQPTASLGVLKDLSVFMLRLFVRCTPICGRQNRSGIDEIMKRHTLPTLAWSSHWIGRPVRCVTAQTRTLPALSVQAEE